MIYKDAIGNEFDNVEPYLRIVSLVPSQTEYLIQILNHQTQAAVVGRTKFCIHPTEIVKDIQIVGGTKQIDVVIIKELHPDLIILNKEENTQEIYKSLENICPIYVSEIKTINDAFAWMKDIAGILNVSNIGEDIIQRIESEKAEYESNNYSCIKVAYLIWKDPYMTIGGDTFISQMLSSAGFENVFDDLERYPEVNIDTLEDAQLDILFLSSEPFPFKQKHVEQMKENGLKSLVVDGELFSWYGSRMINSWKYFSKLRTRLQEII